SFGRRTTTTCRGPRYLRLSISDTAIRPAYRRYHLGPGPTAEGHGAVLRAPEGRGDQLRDARPGAREDLLRQPHAPLYDGAASARVRCREPHDPSDGSALSD